MAAGCCEALVGAIQGHYFSTSNLYALFHLRTLLHPGALFLLHGTVKRFRMFSNIMRMCFGRDEKFTSPYHLMTRSTFRWRIEISQVCHFSVRVFEDAIILV